MLTVGEVHTGFLRNSTSVSADRSSRVLALMDGEQVRHSARPLPYAISPDRLRGIDCRLAAASGARHRAVGTVVARASITGGHVLQGSAYARLAGGTADRRLAWPHYLTRPGLVETLGKVDWSDLADGLLAESPPADSLDLGAMCAEVMHIVQASSDLDQKTPLRTSRTQLRWAALVDGDRRRTVFAIEERGLRTLRLSLPAEVDDLAAIAATCEDLALHDWLLTSLQTLIDGSGIGAIDRAQVIRRFGPAFDHLVHLWMPAARVDRSLWAEVERRPGMERQWDACVNRIRDQVAVGRVDMRSRAAAGLP